ncbi:MAG TPA: molybdate ABC transporter substrate-binding protein, partial [Symbiobacteriaceae bacterium]|nr:molybdate ABC transporter substrate-binding protein [Symbiobacteriaceae bacterium]
MRRALLLIFAFLLLSGCGSGPARSTEVVVSAAASLKEVLTDLAGRFEAQDPSVKIRLNFGSSGALQQQIEQGAPADLFIAAGPAPMQALVDKGLVEQAAVKPLATNRLVLIRPKAQDAALIDSWQALTGGKVTRLAIGNPQHVPAGQYGKAVLEKLGLWAGLQRTLVLGEDVRQVLHYVESGEVQAGIVYGSDAASSQKVAVVAEAPPGSHGPVIYPMAVLKTGKPEAAR